MPVRARSCAAERRSVGNGPGPPAGSPALVRAISARADRSAVLEVHGALCTDRGAHAPTQRAAQELEGSGEVFEAVLGDLVLLDDDAGERVVVQRPTVEEKSHAPRLPRARAEEVDAHEASGGDHEPALLAHLAPTGLPRSLAVVLHLPAGHGPSTLVGRLQDQETPGAVEDQGPRRRRDPRDLEDRLVADGVAGSHQPRFPLGALDVKDLLNRRGDTP